MTDQLEEAIVEVLGNRYGLQRHWACGLIECNCDELVDRARDEESRDE